MLVSGHIIRDEAEGKPWREADAFPLLGWLFILRVAAAKPMLHGVNSSCTGSSHVTNTISNFSVPSLSYLLNDRLSSGV